MRAVVLSAGYGTRLGQLTREVPKPMLPLGGRPLLEHLLLHLARHGFRDVIVNLHFRPDLVRDHFGDGSRLGISITYLDEPALLGTAGTLTALESELAGGPFLVHYGDVLTGHDLAALAAAHRAGDAAATLLVHERPGSNSVLVLGPDGRVKDFVERPAADDPVRERSSWSFSGICVCEPSVLAVVPPPPADLARDVLPALARSAPVSTQPLAGLRIAVDSPDRYRRAVGVAAALTTPGDP